MGINVDEKYQIMVDLISSFCIRIRQTIAIQKHEHISTSKNYDFEHLFVIYFIDLISGGVWLMELFSQ